jgi:hypothetical protein
VKTKIMRNLLLGIKTLRVPVLSLHSFTAMHDNESMNEMKNGNAKPLFIVYVLKHIRINFGIAENIFQLRFVLVTIETKHFHKF